MTIDKGSKIRYYFQIVKLKTNENKEKKYDNKNTNIHIKQIKTIFTPNEEYITSMQYF